MGQTDAVFERHGLSAWRGPISSMAQAHRHSEIELNFVSRGEIQYLFGGQTVRLGPRRLMLFWGAFPHRLTGCADGSILTWLTLPLARFLAFGLPEALVQSVLHGVPILEPGLEGDTGMDDEAHLLRWLRDTQDLTGERQRILELELEARLRRLALGALRPTAKPQQATPERDGSRAAQLAEFISTHYLEPIRLQDIAHAVGLNTNYASELFRNTFSMTILEFLTQHRLAHAQRLLATSDASVLEITFDSGFGSSSRFHTAFVRVCGVSPSAYRNNVRRNL